MPYVISLHTVVMCDLLTKLSDVPEIRSHFLLELVSTELWKLKTNSGWMCRLANCLSSNFVILQVKIGRDNKARNSHDGPSNNWNLHHSVWTQLYYAKTNTEHIVRYLEQTALTISDQYILNPMVDNHSTPQFSQS